MTSKEQRDLDKLLALIDITGTPELREIANDYKRHRRQGAVAFDSADDLSIGPIAKPAYTKDDAIADLKLAMLFKTPKEKAQIAKDCKRILRELEEE